MDWQFVMAVVVVSLAGAFLARRGWRMLRDSSGGCGGCACNKTASPQAKPALIPSEQLILRKR